MVHAITQVTLSDGAKQKNKGKWITSNNIWLIPEVVDQRDTLSAALNAAAQAADIPQSVK